MAQKDELHPAADKAPVAPADRPLDSRERAETLDEVLRSFVREHPVACLLGSTALGFLAGRLVRRGDS